MHNGSRLGIPVRLIAIRINCWTGDNKRSLRPKLGDSRMTTLIGGFNLTSAREASLLLKDTQVGLEIKINNNKLEMALIAKSMRRSRRCLPNDLKMMMLSWFGWSLAGAGKDG